MSTQVLKPWQRVPAAWVCAECGGLPTGSFETNDGAVFYCGEHYDSVSDPLMERYGYASGYGMVREPWRYWWSSTEAYSVYRGFRRRFSRPACEVHGWKFDVDFNEFASPEPKVNAATCEDVSHRCGHESHSVDLPHDSFGQWVALKPSCPACRQDTVVWELAE